MENNETKDVLPNAHETQVAYDNANTENEGSNKKDTADNTPLDKNLRLMSPTRMVLRRFFRSKLSVIGLVMVVGLFLFSFLGPYIYHLFVPATDVLGNAEGRGWQQDEKDESGKWEYTASEFTEVMSKVTFSYVDKETNETVSVTYDYVKKQSKDSEDVYYINLYKDRKLVSEDEAYVTLKNNAPAAVGLNGEEYILTPKAGQADGTAYVGTSEAASIDMSIVNTEIHVKQTLEKFEKDNSLAQPSKLHPLGTDKSGYDVLSRLMYGGRVSLIVSFLAVFIITVLGVIAGGIAGYFGGVIDNIIMRICDILMCLPGIPILLIVGVLLNGWISEGYQFISGETRIYFLMIFISCISWPGTARLVRGQILSLREQEYMVAAEAMGYSTARKIFKHLIPNVMPQLIVQMTLGLGSMIIYESTLSYLGFGVKAPNTAWGTILNLFEEANGFEIAMANPIIWVPAGLCIVIAVLGFNFVGDGLRDALDPKSRR